MQSLAMRTVDELIIILISWWIIRCISLSKTSLRGTRYGWFQIGVDQAGELNILSSAWDLDGDAIVVGAIPEPTSGMLVLLGMAALALKRRAQ